MKIVIPVVFEIPEDEIEKEAEECGADINAYMDGLLWDKTEWISEILDREFKNTGLSVYVERSLVNDI